MSANRSGSVLAVDFGNVHTRAVLIDVVEGRYQLVSQARTRTTAAFPYADISVGLRRVLEQLGATTGRNLFVPASRIITPEQPDRSGVDHFLATASIGRPLRTVLIGLVPDVSLASGIRATSGTYVQVIETLTLADVRTQEEQVNAIVLGRPDLIFITGGTEDGASQPVLQLAATARLALQLMTAQRKPPVLYAGNSALVPEIRSLFEGQTALFVAPNVRPAIGEEELEGSQLQLALAFDASSTQRGSGFETVGSQSRLGILPTAQSYSLMVDYMGRAQESGLVALDVGSATSTFAAWLSGKLGSSIRTDLGLGHSAQTLLDAVGVHAIRGWLPFFISADELTVYAIDKTLRPGVVPETLREMYVEYAFLRAGVRAMIRASLAAWDKTVDAGEDVVLPPFERVIGAGSVFTETGRPGLTAMLLLDCLMPEGVVTLSTDSAALIPALGALAHMNPAAVVQVLESNGLERLGVSINVGGVPRAGRRALHVKITPDSGQGTVEHDVEGGSLWVFPLPSGVRARVEIRVTGRGLSIGGKTRLKFDVEGGGAGIIFDARGRPLPLAVDVRARAAQMTAWLAQATGDAIIGIDPAWLNPAAADKAAPEAAPVAAKGRKAAKVAPVKESKQDKKSKNDGKPDKRGRRRSGRLQEAEELEDDDLDELRDLLS